MIVPGFYSVVLAAGIWGTIVYLNDPQPLLVLGICSGLCAGIGSVGLWDYLRNG